MLHLDQQFSLSETRLLYLKDLPYLHETSNREQDLLWNKEGQRLLYSNTILKILEERFKQLKIPRSNVGIEVLL